MGIITRKSFTLMEMIVAVGVVGLILPAVFAIFFTIIRQQLVLISYQEMKQQGDSAERNIKNILQNRAAYITDSGYEATDVCPLPLIPTPTIFPDSNLFIKDRDGISIKLYKKTLPSIDTIASDSADIIPVPTKTYYLTSQDVTISSLSFTCYRVNEFTPPIVSTTFTVQKSSVFTNISLPYSFNVRLRNY